MVNKSVPQDPDYSGTQTFAMPKLPKPLSADEKRYFLSVERGDIKTTRQILIRSRIDAAIDVNCVDSLGRSTMLIAVENENLEMIRALTRGGVLPRDALLHAIDKEYVEGVEFLLAHETEQHTDGQLHSWETVETETASFTPEITPLILAAHRDNYEILKLLLDVGATLPVPHDVRCPCNECVKSSQEDSLRHSRRRFNAYRALSSPSLIALSSTDPVLTAFELCWELKNLAMIENEYKEDYLELRTRCQDFAVNLLAHARSSAELEILLNYDPAHTAHDSGNPATLARLRVAIDRNQKTFVAHPNVQQLLSALWFKGLPGFRRKNMMMQLLTASAIVVLFPLYSLVYMIAPRSATGKIMRKPFMKFLIHSASYLFFLFLLILASQRIEDVISAFLESRGFTDSRNSETRAIPKRGLPPTFVEWLVLFYIMGFVWQETRQLWSEGIKSYVTNMWNAIDFIRNLLYVLTIGLRFLSFVQTQLEISRNEASAYIPRERWGAFDPMLIAEGLFAAANIFSALKLLHMFSINPYLGPLQISLGRMVIDIIKFFFIYSLVLFAFACGLNQLLWYYADLERQKCFSLPGGLADWKSNSDSCMIWRRFINLFESSQSLFWASFGMIDLRNFELTGIQSYTRFWAMLMFGSYSVINVIVLLNLLIAMMSTSYNIISDRSDIEWKFARTKLWLTYFDDSATLPPPFNIIITPKHIMKIFSCCFKKANNNVNKKQQNQHFQYQTIVQSLVWRYVTSQQRKSEYTAVTEDHVNEVKQDISAFRFELMDVLNQNGMEVKRKGSITKKQSTAAALTTGKKARVWERRLMNDFTVSPVESCSVERTPEGAEETLTKFRRLVRMVNQSEKGRAVQLWRDLAQAVRKQSHAVLISETIAEEKEERSPIDHRSSELRAAEVVQPLARNLSTIVTIEVEPPHRGKDKNPTEIGDLPIVEPEPASIINLSAQATTSGIHSTGAEAQCVDPTPCISAQELGNESIILDSPTYDQMDDLNPLIPISYDNKEEHIARIKEAICAAPLDMDQPPNQMDEYPNNASGVQQVEISKKQCLGNWL